MRAGSARRRRKWLKARKSRRSLIRCPLHISSLHRAAVLMGHRAPVPSPSHKTTRRSPFASTAKMPRALSATRRWFTYGSNTLLDPTGGLWAQFHLRVDPIYAGFDESQPRIQPLCRVRVEYLQLQHRAGVHASLDQRAYQFAADALPAVFGKQGNIEQPPYVGFALYDHAANRLMVLFNDLVLGATVCGCVPLLLRIELHAQKSFLLNNSPPKTA